MDNEKPEYDFDETKIEYFVSGQKHLIVEGPRDKKIFEILFYEFEDCLHNNPIHIFIDNIDVIKYRTEEFQYSSNGNRGKVENFHEIIINDPKIDKKNFVCFVDREFRYFEVKSCNISDKLTSLQLKERLICSRGHSIENYFFDFVNIKIALSILCCIDNIHELYQAINLFSKVFESSMYIATMISIIGNQINCSGYFKRILLSIDASIFKIEQDRASINLESWQIKLRKNFNENEIEKIINSYQSQHQVITNNNIDLIKLYSHGHIGFECFLAVYACYIYEVSQKNKKSNMFRFNKDQLYIIFAKFWAIRAKENKNNCNYPKEIFSMLGITIE